MNQDERAAALSLRSAALQRKADAEAEVNAIDARLAADDELHEALLDPRASSPQPHVNEDDEPANTDKLLPDFGPSVIRKTEDGLPPAGHVDGRVSMEGALKAAKSGSDTVYVRDSSEDESVPVDSFGVPLEEAPEGQVSLDEIMHSDEGPVETGFDTKTGKNDGSVRETDASDSDYSESDAGNAQQVADPEGNVYEANEGDTVFDPDNDPNTL